MKISLIAVAALTVSLAACGDEAPRTTLHFDWRGSREGLQLARAAAREWSTVCGVGAFVIDADGASIDDVVAVVEVADASGLLGVTHTDDGRVEWIRVLRQADPVKQQTTLAHEFGHAFGIKEHAPTGLMTREWHGEEHVSPADCSLIP